VTPTPWTRQERRPLHRAMPAVDPDTRSPAGAKERRPPRPRLRVGNSSPLRSVHHALDPCVPVLSVCVCAYACARANLLRAGFLYMRVYVCTFVFFWGGLGCCLCVCLLVCLLACFACLLACFELDGIISSLCCMLNGVTRYSCLPECLGCIESYAHWGWALAQRGLRPN